MELDEARSALEAGRKDEPQRVEVTPQEEETSQTEEVSLAKEVPQAEISSEAPVNLNDILERMGTKPVDDDLTQPGIREQVEMAPASDLQQQPEDAVSFADDDDDEHNNEESLDSYMSRLMDRVRSVSGPAVEDAGKSKPSPPPPAKRAKQASAAAGDTASKPTEQTAALGEHSEPAQEKLRDLSPRGVAPERGMSLSSMRELANVSAQTAINRHAKRQFRHAARSKLLVASIGLVAGGILMYFWWFMGERGPIFYAGLLAFLVALFWGFQFAIMSGKVSASRGNVERLVKMMSHDDDLSERNDKAAADELSDSADNH